MYFTRFKLFRDHRFSSEGGFYTDYLIPWLVIHLSWLSWHSNLRQSNLVEVPSVSIAPAVVKEASGDWAILASKVLNVFCSSVVNVFYGGLMAPDVYILSVDLSQPPVHIQYSPQRSPIQTNKLRSYGSKPVEKKCLMDAQIIAQNEMLNCRLPSVREYSCQLVSVL